MAVFTPGALILWRPSGSTLPRWPAVVCVDKMAPDDFLRNRPSGYVTLVLRISDVYSFHWASTTEMHEYDPYVQFNQDSPHAETPGLGEAFAIADSALDAGLGLDHWTAEYKRQAAMVIISDDEQMWSDFGDLDDDTDSDSELNWAIRESQRCSQAHNRPADKKPSQGNATSANPSYEHALRKTPTARPIPPVRFPFEQTSGSLLGLDRLGQSFTAPTSDVVEGELNTSNEFVQIKVGEEESELVLPMSCLWSRPYFRDARAGVMHFTHNEDNLWELTHPGLSEVEPEDFAFAAEFLESGQFGLKMPVGQSENREAFAQCMSGWATADTLGMIDMMDHIVDKLTERIELDLWDMMVFACRFYEGMDVSLPAHDRLKDFLATYLAENFWIYIRDDHFSSVFIDRIQALPELEHDIYVRRTLALTQQLQSDDEDQDDDEEGEGNMTD